MANSPSITFRTSETVAGKLAGEAARTGQPVSEVIRQAVDAWLGLNPAASLHEQAAVGVVDAFAALAAQHYNDAVDQSELAIVGLTRAVTYARLAAMRRGAREDWIALLFLLDQQAIALNNAGYVEAADQAHGEAVAIAEYASENGDEEIGDLVLSAGSALSAGAMRHAATFTWIPDRCAAQELPALSCFRDAL